MGSAVRRAHDRVDIEIVLPSGVVLKEGGLDKPVPPPESAELEPGVTWALVPGARSSLIEGHLTVSFDLLPDQLVEENGRISIARIRRTVDIELDPSTLKSLLDKLSLGLSLEHISRGFAPSDCETVHEVLVDLVGWGAAVNVKDARPRLAHAWSMRGSGARGRLFPSEVVDLTFTPRTYAHESSAAIGLPDVRPFPVDSLATLLRRRRSPVSYDASSISIDMVGQLLGGACGVTGELALGDRVIPLRAYPSPGALYAVDTYLIPTRVPELGDGVFRYDAEHHALVVVHDRPVNPASFCLPDVRHVVDGVAAFIALTICFQRVTSKYGDESYRILVAEAGCIAENIILVAHALGLRAGPFTGVFDGLVDKAIDAGAQEASFVVGVLIGREGIAA
jgi:SagB-type dehydrogenase family enzyme